MAVFSSSRARGGAREDLRLQCTLSPQPLPCEDPGVLPLRVLTLTLIVLQDVGCKAALVTHIGGILPILGLDDPLEVVVDLRANAHGFLEGAGSHRQNHELLHGQLVSSMRAPIDHIEGLRGREGVQTWARV